MKVEIKLPSNKAFIAKLKKSQDVIAKERDRIRNLISEYEDLADCCDGAIDDIEFAVDKLSQYV